MLRQILFTCTIIICFLLTACSPANTPIAISKQWINALSSLDAENFTGLTCARLQEGNSGPNMWTSLFQILSMGAGSSGKLLDASKLQYKEISNDGETAYVQVLGTMNLNLGGESLQQPVDEVWRLVLEGGNWKWCGSGSQ